MPVTNIPALIENRVNAIRQYHEEAGIQKAELDLSGGIDSAVMACLLVEALGPENVILVHSRMSSNSEQSNRAKALASALKCPLNDIDLTDVYEQIVSLAKAAIVRSHNTAALDGVEYRCRMDKTILGSVRSTLRAPVGRMFNRLLGGGIRHGTGNECEDRWLRFYQKGGDGEVDTNPIAMLSKTEVFQLAWGLGEKFGGAVRDAMRATIKAIPSPDLWGEGDGHNDEDELLAWTGAPFTYGRINPETGEVVRYGTIEMVARFLDQPAHPSQGGLNQDHLFGERDPSPEAAFSWSCWVERAAKIGCFPGVAYSDIERLLKAARRAEKVTRHKLNPNIPALGSRESLVERGILSNDLG